MNPLFATAIYIAGIAALFYLDRDRTSRVSKGLLVPFLWLLIIASRPVSMWFQSGPTVSQEQAYEEGSPIDAAVYGCLIALGLVVLSRRGARVRQYLGANPAIVLFLLYCGVSIAWSDYSFVAFKRWIKAVGDVIAVMVVLTEYDAETAVRQLLSKASFLLLPVSILFIKYYPDLGRAYNPWTGLPMYSGVTTFKNLLGMTCLICGIGSLWAFLSALQDRQVPGSKRRLIAHGSMAIVALWLIVMANSMTSLSCYLMSGFLLVLAMRREPTVRASVLRSVMIGCIALSFFSMFIDPTSMLRSIGRDPTLTGRTDIWRAVLAMHTNPLIGSGFESFWMGKRLIEVGRMTEKGIQEAHNGYLEVYINLGFVGLAFLAAVIYAGYKNVNAQLQSDRSMAALRLSFITAGLIYSFAEAGFRMMSPIWVCMLIAVSCTPIGKPPELNPYLAKMGWDETDVPVKERNTISDVALQEANVVVGGPIGTFNRRGSSTGNREWELSQ